MPHYHYIEDYILDMGATFLTWPPKQSQIKLARYDETIVQSMSDQVSRGLAFTDKQAELAVKLVTKYRKQWSKLGFDITDQIHSHKFKFPIRKIDRSKSLEIENNRVCIRFSYDQNLISEIRSSNDIPGNISFDKDSKFWKAALTPPRIIWCGDFAVKHKFDVGPQFLDLLSSIESQASTVPMLTEVNDSLVILNAENSLLEYIESQGGITYNNIFTLLDLSGSCCYQVDQSLISKYIGQDIDLIGIFTNKNKNIEYRDFLPLDPIIKYITMTGIKHVAIYDDNTLKLFDKLSQHFADKLGDNLNIVCYNNFSTAKKRVNLLLTSHTYMIGHRRQLMCQYADKIINFTHIVDQPSYESN